MASSTLATRRASEKKQLEAREAKKRLAERLFVRRDKPVLAQETRHENENKVEPALLAIPSPPKDSVQCKVDSERYGKAGVHAYREDDTTPSTPGVALEQFINLYLASARDKSRHIVLQWPVSPKALSVAHILATFERWASGDKRGIRGLLFPTKTNAFHPLNHLKVSRKDVLRHANALAETSGRDSSHITRKLQEKDAFHFSLGSLQKEDTAFFNPTMGELIPHFLAAQGFQKWESCSPHLLEHTRAKLAKRTQKKALLGNCDVMGGPGTAPDALFALDGRLSKDELRLALRLLKQHGSPEVVIVNATRSIRIESRGWRAALTKFCLLLEDVFGSDRPGVLLVTDDPRVAYQLREDLWKLNSTRPKEKQWSSASEYSISAVANSLKDEGLVPPGQEEVIAPIPREFDVSIVDADAAKVINKLYRLASQVPGGSDNARPLLDAASYLSRLAALPCGVTTLVEWLSESGIRERTRALYSWGTFHAALVSFDQQTDVDMEHQTLRDCMKLGTKLYENYQMGTPLSHRLAEIVGKHCGKPRKNTVVVFTSAIYRRLAERFLATYDDYPDGAKYEDFSARLELISSSQLEQKLSDLNGAKLVFSGLDEEGLRLLITDNRIPAHTAVLLTQRNGQSLRATLRPLVSQFPAFRSIKPRMESLLRQVETLPDINGTLSLSDFVLPSFKVELATDIDAASEAADPEAWQLRLENGASMYCRQNHDVYVYDPASEDSTERGFRCCKVQSLSPGDKIFVMSSDLRELVEAVLREAGIPIEHDKTFEGAMSEYHASIMTRLGTQISGKNLTDQVRRLRTQIVADNPSLKTDFPAEQAVRNWVNLGSISDKPFDQRKPQAPMKEAHFRAFALALGFNSLEAAYYWQRVIMPIRNARRLDGRHVSDLYTHMLLQPESAMVHSGIKRQTIKMLFQKARENTVTLNIAIPPKGETQND